MEELEEGSSFTDNKFSSYYTNAMSSPVSSYRFDESTEYISFVKPQTTYTAAQFSFYYVNSLGFYERFSESVYDGVAEGCIFFDSFLVFWFEGTKQLYFEDRRYSSVADTTL